MLQFTVPQFIDVEDKIFGPITTRQFIIVLTGFIIIGVFYKLLDFTAFLTFGILTLIITVVIAFVKVNGMPFHFFLLNFMQTLKKPNLRVWNKIIEKIIAIDEDVLRAAAAPAVRPKTYTSSRLAELALIVDTKGAYRGNDTNKNITISNSDNQSTTPVTRNS